MLEKGSQAPRFRLEQVDGEPIALSLAYYRETATDRPSVDELLSVLREPQQEGRA